MNSFGICQQDHVSCLKNGKLIAIYLEDEIGGFAFHLVQK